MMSMPGSGGAGCRGGARRDRRGHELPVGGAFRRRRLREHVAGCLSAATARAEHVRERDRLDRVTVGVDHEIEQADQPVEALQPRIDLRMLAEDPQQLVLVGKQLTDAVVVLSPADEVLLAGVADDVAVGVAEADERERVRVAQLLVAGLDVDARVVAVVSCCCSSGDRRRRRRSRSRRRGPRSR